MSLWFDGETGLFFLTACTDLGIMLLIQQRSGWPLMTDHTGLYEPPWAHRGSGIWWAVRSGNPSHCISTCSSCISPYVFLHTFIWHMYVYLLLWLILRLIKIFTVFRDCGFLDTLAPLIPKIKVWDRPLALRYLLHRTKKRWRININLF